MSCYSATGELSIAKHATDHLEGLKHELKGIDKDREPLKTKRLLSVEGDNGKNPSFVPLESLEMFIIPYQNHLYFFSPYIRFCCGLPTGTLLYLDKIACGSISYHPYSKSSAMPTRAASFP